eukprot:gene3585-biopygen5868
MAYFSFLHSKTDDTGSRSALGYLQQKRSEFRCYHRPVKEHAEFSALYSKNPEKDFCRGRHTFPQRKHSAIVAVLVDAQRGDGGDGGLRLHDVAGGGDDVAQQLGFLGMYVGTQGQLPYVL